MKRARLVVLGIALFAAIGAAMMAKRMVASRPGPTVVEHSTVETYEVLVAGKDVALGDPVGAGDLKWQVWPKDAAVSGYITKSKSPDAVSRLSGAIARAPMLAGEPIKEQKLIRAGEGGVMAAILPAGARAISTPIREETAAGGFILPNDRVDVIVSRKIRSSRREEHVSETVLRNVRVLAIGQSIEQKGDAKVANGKTATLELSPRQAEILALAQSMGDISLALRSLIDPSAGGSTADNEKNPFGDRGGTIKILKYSIPSQAYGVN